MMQFKKNYNHEKNIDLIRRDSLRYNIYGVQRLGIYIYLILHLQE